jgi:D-3-phosphoglycerate dehydrogenase
LIHTLNIEPLHYSKTAIALYRSFGSYDEVESSDIRFQELNFHSINVLLVRLGNHLGESFLSRFQNLKYIVTPTTGLDHIDDAYCYSKGIEVVSLRDDKDFLNSITSTPELTWGLLLSLIRNIPNAHNSVLQGKWERDKYRGYQLRGKTVGIIGLGRTGSQMAIYAKAFGMRVVYYDPNVNTDIYDRKGELNDLLEESDIVSLHVHLNKETEEMINENNLQFLKPSAFILNTSRGKVINEEDLVKALEDKKIKGAAVDVLSTELYDIQKSPILKAAQRGLNIVITPHIGGATFDAMHICEEFIASKLINRIKDNSKTKN